MFYLMLDVEESLFLLSPIRADSDPRTKELRDRFFINFQQENHAHAEHFSMSALAVDCGIRHFKGSKVGSHGMKGGMAAKGIAVFLSRRIEDALMAFVNVLLNIGKFKDR